MNYDVIGIGNPLIDLLLKVNEDLVVELNLNKGNFNPISQEQLNIILDKIQHHDITKAPGDSTANTLAGISRLGGNVIFCGKIGNDESGIYYEEKLEDAKVLPKLSKTNGTTGQCLCFITPDSERTFAAHLGVCIDLKKEDILEEDIKQSKILHLTGYQLENKNLRETAFHAMEIAKKNNLKISIDLADPGLITRCKEDLLDIVKNFADIIFVNELEAKAFTGLEEKDALNEIAKLVDIAIVKLGEKGSLIKSNDEYHEIQIFPVEVVDTTGAGDMYAAGVLYGISNNLSLERSGKIGSYVASLVVSQIGARLNSHIDIENIK